MCTTTSLSADYVPRWTRTMHNDATFGVDRISPTQAHATTE